MKLHTKAVHGGERKPAPAQIPVSVPIYTGASYIGGSMAEIDRIFEGAQQGFVYQRYTNPTNAALEQQVAALEGGPGALACASGMAALDIAIRTALLDRPKRLLVARDIYGATLKLSHLVLEPYAIEIAEVDSNSLAGVESALKEKKTGALVVETISNPLLRVADVDALARLCRTHGAALIVDNTFATPLLNRPLEHGAHLVVHSVTKYLAGHGDVLGGMVAPDKEHYEPVRAMSRIVGAVLGPFESYLTLRGVKTFPLRMERQCANALRLYEWLRGHAAVDRVYYPADPAHPDAEVVRRMLPDGLFGGMVSFEIKGADKEGVWRFLDRLKLVVRATSLGDVHTIILHPWMSSHRDVPPKQKERVGIRVNLVRISAGIEDIDDILADLDQALRPE